MSFRQLCQATFVDANIGFGVCGLEGLLPPPMTPLSLLPSLLNVNPLAEKRAASSSIGIVSVVSVLERGEPSSST